MTSLPGDRIKGVGPGFCADRCECGICREARPIEPELRQVRRELRAAEFVPKDPLDRLRASVEFLIDTFGLYAAGPLIELRERLDPDVDDNAGATQLWTERLTLAIVAAQRALDEAFSPEALEERQARIDDMLADERRWAENAGYQRGRSEEVAARMSEEAGPVPVTRRREGPIRVEPHLRAW